MKHTNYIVLLKTRCGCSKMIDQGFRYPGPWYEVMLTPKLDFGQYDMFKDIDVTAPGPTRRRFRAMNRKWADDAQTTMVVEYVEEPE